MDDITVPPLPPSSSPLSPLLKEALISAVVFFIGVGAGFYFGTLSIDTVEKDQNISAEIPSGRSFPLENEVSPSDSLAPILAPLYSSPTPKKKSVLPPAPPTRPATYTEPFVHILTPNGGESLCIGSTHKIKWEGWGIDTVVLSVRNRYNNELNYPLGAHRATSTDSGTTGTNYYTWKVGTSSGIPLPSNANYEVYAKSVVGSRVYTDTSDRVFSVKECK